MFVSVPSPVAKTMKLSSLQKQEQRWPLQSLALFNIKADFTNLR